MGDIPIEFWISSAISGIVCCSAVVLTIQRRFLLATRPEEHNLEFDKQRDHSAPFSDTDRVRRLNFGTLALTLVSVFAIYCELQTFANEQHKIYCALSACFILVSWIYSYGLVLTSYRHQLPNSWGWVLNVHLYIFYCVIWRASIYDAWAAPLYALSWSAGLPILMRIVLGADLIYTSATSKRGPSFLDKDGKKVVDITIASIFGYFYFDWLTPLIRLAYQKKKLDDDDLPRLPRLFRGETIYIVFGRHCDRSLLYRLFRAGQKTLTIQFILSIITAGLYYAPAFFLNRLLLQIQNYERGTGSNDIISHGLLTVCGLGSSIVVTSILTGQMWYSSAVCQVRFKYMLNIEIYRKTLRRMDTAISSKHWSDDRSSIYAAEAGGAQESSTGTIVNLMSTDSTRITDFCRMWYNVVSAPVELLVGVLFLYQLLGVSCLLGLMVLVITLPINHYTAKLFARTNNRIMEARDKRVNLINEVLQGIRQIKFFAWEKSWEKRIMEARNVELGHLRMGYMCEALFQWLWQGTPILVTIASFWSFTKLEGNELSAPIAFTAIAIFTELRFALNAVPEVFIELLQALISVRRIETYLREDEIIQPPPIDPKDPIRIGFSDATIGWKKTSLDENGNVSDHSSFVLKDVSVQFPNGELSLICGATGSGKTLMILSLLGEAVILRGQVFFPRTAVADSVPDELTIPSNILVKDWLLDHAVAYVSQTAWLQHASIRDNILFGLPYIKERYQATLTACTLDQDLAIFEDGDATEIGERGITLSGGQKARVSLARAVYSRARTVLMDDVLGAVDAHTAKHLFSKCLTGPLMSGRTRILITHHVRLCLDDSAYIVHVRDGRVDIAGNLSEVRQSDALISILGSEDENEDISSDEEYGSGYTKQPYVTNEIYVEADTTTSPPRILIEEEGRSTGSVSRRVYQTYMGVVGGAFFWLLMAILVFGSRGMDIAESWWIKKWAQSYPRPENNSTAADPSYMMSAMPDSFQSFDVTRTLGTVNNVDFYLKIYICIALANTVIGTSRFAVLYVGVLRASKILYIQLLRRVFRAPLRFFDSIPIGRVLNRFAKDFETVDSTIPNVTLNFVAQALVVLSSILTVSFVLPIFLIPMMLVAICNIAFGVLFLAGTVEMKRLDSVTKSPLFSHFTETIAGVTTIRAFGATRMFLQDMLKRIDTNSRPFYYTWLTSRWVSIRYSVTGAAINMTIATIILFNLDRMDVAQAGFCLSFVLLYSNQMSDAVKQYTSMEVNFNAVERVVEFLDVEQEAPAITDLKPPANWPTKGCIEVQNLEVRYTADLEPVLRDMTFSVNAREKIGVVGRTGSGKSTLALSFFRFLEASKGKITIDGVDIKDIGTEDLRRNLTIIPQDPIMFTGTLRSNVDPFDRFSDDEIFIALRCVHLLPSTEDDDAEFLGENTNIFQNLESPVSEGGKNFSQGQRQLLCLARALLKRDRIVWMDEATASVDFPTDKAIQKTIATEFADCTILCIAHRLHTVIEYDRIMVLDRGQLVEFSSPLELITDPSSLFYSMCRNSGEFDSLLALAKGKHQLVDVDVDV